VKHILDEVISEAEIGVAPVPTKRLVESMVRPSDRNREASRLKSVLRNWRRSCASKNEWLETQFLYGSSVATKSGSRRSALAVIIWEMHLTSALQ
jgi:hypothetical protein